jgi:PIN domain nuclease of toxin-antitoxin system
MKVLLDTHVLYWWFTSAERLSKRAFSLLTEPDNLVLISPATGWELAIKANLGKLNALPLVSDLHLLIEEDGFEELPVRIDHAVRAGLLPLHHRDPFDRLLVAQAQTANLPILSEDSLLDRYDVKRIW